MHLSFNENELSEIIRNIVREEIKRQQPQKEWLTLDEVSEEFGLSKSNIKDKKWRDEHHFPYHQPLGIYGSVHYCKSEIEDWLKGKTQRKC